MVAYPRAEYLSLVDIINELRRIVRSLESLPDIASRLETIADRLESISPVSSVTTKSPQVDFFFPNNKEWRWVPVIQPTVTVKPKSQYVFWDRMANGWLYYMLAVSDDPDILYGLDLHADGIIEIRLSPRMLYNWGLVGGSGYAMHVTRYDDTNKIYAVEMAPGFQNGLGNPFRGRNRTLAQNPTDHDVTVALYAWIIEVG